MNEYTVDWPFWAEDGLCEDGDPILPGPLAAAVCAWTDLFNEKYDYMSGWPNLAVARHHEAEGLRLYEEVKRALPDDSIAFQYWERKIASPEAPNWASDCLSETTVCERGHKRTFLSGVFGTAPAAWSG